MIVYVSITRKTLVYRLSIGYQNLTLSSVQSIDMPFAIKQTICFCISMKRFAIFTRLFVSFTSKSICVNRTSLVNINGIEEDLLNLVCCCCCCCCNVLLLFENVGKSSIFIILLKQMDWRKILYLRLEWKACFCVALNCDSI